MSQRFGDTFPRSGSADLTSVVSDDHPLAHAYRVVLRRAVGMALERPAWAAPPGTDPAAAVLRGYLSAARTASAKALAAKAVILISPEHRVTECAWP